MRKNQRIIALAVVLSLSCSNVAHAKWFEKHKPKTNKHENVLIKGEALPENTSEELLLAYGNKIHQTTTEAHDHYMENRPKEEPMPDDETIPQSSTEEHEAYMDGKLETSFLEDPKKEKHKKAPKNKTLSLKAVFFDPKADFEAQAEKEGREMTFKEEIYAKLHEDFHGEVAPISQIFLIDNERKTIHFDKGPVASITPWADYSSVTGFYWTGEDYGNTLYRTRFQDVGINGKFRKPFFGKGHKTVFRIMANTGLSIPNTSYMQSVWFDNYIMHYFTPNDQVLVGHARTAMGFEGSQSPYTIPFVGRSMLANHYGNVRASGVKFQGKHKMYEYSVGGFSSDRWFRKFMPGMEFVGQAVYKPLGKFDGKYGNLKIGGTVNAGRNSHDYTAGIASLDYEYKRWWARFEAGMADGSNGARGLTKNESCGFNGTLAYRVTPKIQALVRYDQFDPNRNKDNDLRREFTTGLNYFIKGHAAKVMLNYTMYSLENGLFGSRILLGTQIVL